MKCSHVPRFLGVYEMIHSTGCQPEAWVIQFVLSFAVRIKISVRFDENGENIISEEAVRGLK